MLCAFSGHPDKLVQWVTNGTINAERRTGEMNIHRCRCNRQREEEVGGGGMTVREGGAPRGLAVLSRDKNGRQASSPSVSGEHIVGVSEAVAAR